MSGLDEGLRDVGPSDRAVSGDLLHPRQLHGDAELSETLGDALVAQLARPLHLVERGLERFVLDVHEVSEHMDLVLLRADAQLDCRDDGHARPAGRFERLRDAFGRVVVGYPQEPHAPRSRLRDRRRR